VAYLEKYNRTAVIFYFKICFLASCFALASLSDVSAGMAIMMFEVCELSDTEIIVKDEHGDVFIFERLQKDIEVGDEAIVASDLQHKGNGVWEWNTKRTAIIDIERKKE
jgi:hypothetical protein